MANPVQPQQAPQQQAPALVAAPPQPAPRGLGAAPSRLQPPPSPPAPPQKGYILSAAAWIKNFLISVWDWLCTNIWGIPPRPAQQPPAAPPAPVDPQAQPHRDLFQRLNQIPSAAEIVRLFGEYYDDEIEQEEVYEEIGRAAPSLSLGSWLQTFGMEEREKHVFIGKQMAARSPSLLIGSIQRKAHQRAYPN